jgi:hypothetical protein
MQTDGLAPFRSSRLRKNRVFTVIFLMRAAAMTDGVMGRDLRRMRGTVTKFLFLSRR